MGGKREGSDFQNLHRNKRSLVLNLKSEEGVNIFLKLAVQADVIVENYRPDVKFRLGIDYETIKALNPKIVYASISGFGQDGPLAKRPGFDQIAQGMGGLMSITGEPGKGPMQVGIQLRVTAGALLHKVCWDCWRNIQALVNGSNLAIASTDRDAGFQAQDGSWMVMCQARQVMITASIPTSF